MSNAVPEGYSSVTPMIVFKDARKAMCAEGWNESLDKLAESLAREGGKAP
ncbi:hypothetical protein [Geobacter pickeringii]|nr:hypothetical protein [Geobacter pickeringii]